MMKMEGLTDDFYKTHGDGTKYLLKDKLDLLHKFKNFDGKVANFYIDQLHNPLHIPHFMDLLRADFNMSANIKEDRDMGIVFIDEVKEI
jgi:hypothetical protein